MHENRAFTSHLHGKLAQGFQEREGFDIAYGATHFYDGHIMPCGAINHTRFNFVGNVWNHLNGRAEIVTATLFA